MTIDKKQTIREPSTELEEGKGNRNPPPAAAGSPPLHKGAFLTSLPLLRGDGSEADRGVVGLPVSRFYFMMLL